MTVFAPRKGTVLIRNYVRGSRSDPLVLNKIIGEVLKITSEEGYPTTELMLLTGFPNRWVTLESRYLSEKYFTQLAIVGLENAQLVDLDTSTGIYDIILTLSGGGEESQRVRVFGISFSTSHGTGESYLTLHSKYKILVALYQRGCYLELDTATEDRIINSCLKPTPLPA